MTALVRYLLADVLRAQRFLAPSLLFGAVLGMLYSSDAGPPLPAYAGACALIYPVAVWLTVVIATAEDPVRRSVTAATAGWARTQAAVTLLSAAGATALAVLATVVPVLTQSRPYPVDVVGLGFAGLLVCGLTGVGVGVVCSRPVIVPPGWSVLAASGLVALAFVVGRVPPFGAVLGVLADGDATSRVAVSAACALIFVTAATVLATHLAPRR
ncbi:hypothetical protein GCM10022243_58780 [Saccharothrix violaceirubra]|uniref:ABC-2 type transport system permease protein n=1 Tax=Saccharothrix violaceirubra TaxID=413306 RepID=A0A7W7T1P1_9PSEU|nr:hypothetical protein [Saccharothrix violaceirubra]MBB4964915.1 hypothetical protein [Saccharothrix violaceirubra]